MNLALRSSSTSALMALLWLAAGCDNPVPDAQVALLGPEEPGVPASDIHRPGQPCLLCHGATKGAEPEMTIAGTIYGYAFDTGDIEAAPVPVEGVVIELSDSFGNTPPEAPRTNCAGNFYLTRAQWNPSYPLRVAISYPVPGDADGERVPMGSRISRDGSCAGCHEGEPNQGSPGWVFCTQRGPNAPKFVAPEICVPSGGF